MIELLIGLFVVGVVPLLSSDTMDDHHSGYLIPYVIGCCAFLVVVLVLLYDDSPAPKAETK